MIRFYREGVFISAIKMEVSTAMRIIKIMVHNTGASWSFRESPFRAGSR